MISKIVIGGGADAQDCCKQSEHTVAAAEVTTNKTWRSGSQTTAVYSMEDQ